MKYTGHMDEPERPDQELLGAFRRRQNALPEHPDLFIREAIRLARGVQALWSQSPKREDYGTDDWEYQCGRILGKISKLFADTVLKDAVRPAPRDARRILFLSFTGGLCNRLRAVCALSTVSGLASVPFNWSWAPSPCFPGSAALETQSDALGQAELDTLLEWYREDPAHTLVMINPAAPSTIYRRFRSVHRAAEPDFRDLYRKCQNRFLSALVSQYGLSGSIEQAKKRLGPAYAAVHVRRTDTVGRWNRLCPGLRFPVTEDYAVILDEVLEPTERFFLCCDESVAASEFRSRYGDRVVRFPGSFTNSFRQTTVAHAVADLVLLSGASLVIGTPESSFSSFAIHAGNARALWPCSLPENLRNFSHA